MANASSKQVKYIRGLLGTLIDVSHFQTRAEAWEKLGLLQETKIEELDSKQASEVIKTLKSDVDGYN